MNEQFSSFMYYIDAPTLKVYSSTTEGLTWRTLGSVPAVLTPAMVQGIASLYSNVAELYYSVDGTGQGQAAYFSPDYGATNTDATSSGLGAFTKFHSAPTGPAYAYGFDGKSFRSIDNGVTWKNVGKVGLETYDITAVDMKDHTHSLRNPNRYSQHDADPFPGCGRYVDHHSRLPSSQPSPSLLRPSTSCCKQALPIRLRLPCRLRKILPGSFL